MRDDHRSKRMRVGTKTHGGPNEYAERCAKDREPWPCEVVRLRTEAASWRRVLEGVTEERDHAESELRQLREQIAAAEGAALVEAEQHREDNERGGCTCGFCAWSVEHVVVMSLRAALSSASTPEPCDGVCRNLGCTDDCQTAGPPAAVQPTPEATPLHVREICIRATAHNYGQTVFDIERQEDGRLHVQMSSWPRAEEARKALAHRGYKAAHHGDCGLLVGPEPTPEGEQ